MTYFSPKSFIFVSLTLLQFLLANSITIITGNSTLISPNKTFALGFFTPNPNNQSKHYLAIWYNSIPIPTYVWVANRNSPLKNQPSLEISSGKLSITDSNSNSIIWQTNNTQKGTSVKLLEQGNLVLLSENEEIVWQSFDFPTDTWLPGMNISVARSLISWRTLSDPESGMYSLRLKPPRYGEIELVYDEKESYWSTGSWSGNSFVNVPEMTIPYIYRFHFVDPYTEMASFGYTETEVENGRPLTRFHVDVNGQLRQYTWSVQTESWSRFWVQPENVCRVYGLCGNLGFCNGRNLNPCRCLGGFVAVDEVEFGAGCRRNDDCSEKDGFENVGSVSFDGAKIESFVANEEICRRKCLDDCSCVGMYHNPRSGVCKNVFGSMLNLRNLSSDSMIEDVLEIRVQSGVGSNKKEKIRHVVVLVLAICGFISIVTIIATILFVLRKRRIRREKEEQSEMFPVTNLKVYCYKELHSATRGFSEKLGHGGFGAVFKGELPDCPSPVAVKRLERPGGGEREFRAEVCTIGNIQHVNLVRLRGFCSENSHRLLVYDYMPNGPLSGYLRKESEVLSWDVRFRVAMGTARGIAYLHEECRNCIIHCDIKPENILLDEDYSAKVSDFGLAKLMGRDFSRVLVTVRGTWGYVAPEWISGLAITTKADVYSYGMTLLELIGGRRNVESGGSDGVGRGEKWFFPPWAAGRIIEGNIGEVVDERLCGDYDADEVMRVGMVAVWCIQDEEELRPGMGTVVKMLEGVVEVGVPPPPKMLQELVSGESFHGVGVDYGSGVSDVDTKISRESKVSRLSSRGIYEP